MNELRAYVDAAGKEVFANWFQSLDSTAAAKVAVALTRMEHGNFSNVEGVGRGLYEYKIHFGPGYRVYFGKDGKALIILLGGGTKKRQARDIRAAQESWAEYKRRKTQEKR